MLRKKIGDFYIVRQIGSGRVSESYLAVNPRTREKRVCKIFGKRAAVKPSALAHFLRELEVIKRLAHPGIIKILDIGVFEDCCYYAMEYLAGGNLNRLLARGVLPLEKAAGLFTGICEAMAHAHSKGVLHLELKPSNILLRPEGSPVISDFDIARVLDIDRANAGPPGGILGAIGYQSPEQRFATQKPSQRSDVFALGAIFFEMLMGFPPLGSFPWPRDAQNGFPEFLQKILEKCLAFEPEQRFPHAGFLLTEMVKCGEEIGWDPDRISLAYIQALRASDDPVRLPAKTDRIEAWFAVLRTGTARERLAAVRDMVDKIDPSEAKAILKLYSEEEDHVRWGLIRVLGELKIQAATCLILNDLRNPFLSEHALEALGKIGSDEAFHAIREYLMEHPESAAHALLPLARTGKQRSIRYLRRYLSNEMPSLRRAAVHALATVASEDALRALKEHLCMEKDAGVRSTLFQAVHTLQSILLPEFEITLHDTSTVRDREFSGA